MGRAKPPLTIVWIKAAYVFPSSQQYFGFVFNWIDRGYRRFCK